MMSSYVGLYANSAQTWLMWEFGGLRGQTNMTLQMHPGPASKEQLHTCFP